MQSMNLELCVKSINENKNSVEKTLFKQFGINTNIEAKIDFNNVSIIDKSDDVNKKMRGNKLLKSLFADVKLYGNAWMDEESNSIYMTFHVSYKHPHGGSNGKEIGKFVLNLNNRKTKFLKY